MGKYVIDETTLIGIADAIREKDGTTEGIDPSDMKTRIQAIEAGGGSAANNGWKRVEQSGGLGSWWWEILDLSPDAGGIVVTETSGSKHSGGWVFVDNNGYPCTLADAVGVASNNFGMCDLYGTGVTVYNLFFDIRGDILYAELPYFGKGEKQE